MLPSLAAAASSAQMAAKSRLSRFWERNSKKVRVPFFVHFVITLSAVLAMRSEVPRMNDGYSASAFQVWLLFFLRKHVEGVSRCPGRGTSGW